MYIAHRKLWACQVAIGAHATLASYIPIRSVYFVVRHQRSWWSCICFVPLPWSWETLVSSEVQPELVAAVWILYVNALSREHITVQCRSLQENERFIEITATYTESCACEITAFYSLTILGLRSEVETTPITGYSSFFELIFKPDRSSVLWYNGQ